MYLVCRNFEPVAGISQSLWQRMVQEFRCADSVGSQVYLIQRFINAAWPQPNAPNHYLMSKSGRFSFCFLLYRHRLAVISSLGASACKSVSLGSLEPGINNRIVKYTPGWFIELSETLKKITDVLIWSRLARSPCKCQQHESNCLENPSRGSCSSQTRRQTDGLFL